MTKHGDTSQILQKASLQTTDFFSTLTSFTSNSPSQLQQDSDGLILKDNWLCLYELARRFKIAPIFFNGLRLQESLSFSDPHQSEHSIAFQNTCLFAVIKQQQLHKRQVLKMTYELIRVMNVIAQSHISAVPFKGGILSQKIYGDLYHRSFDDIDIIVNDDDFLACRKLLIDQGYIPAGYEHLSVEKAERFSVFLGECTLVHPRSKVCIDLHGCWLGNGKLTLSTDLSVFTSRLESVQIASSSFDTLSREDTIIFLCLSGLKDSWTSLKTVCDLTVLINTSSDLDWDFIHVEIQNMKVERIVYSGLLLAYSLMKASVPRNVVNIAMSDKKAAWISRRVSQRIIDRVDGKYSWSNEIFLNCFLKWISIKYWQERVFYIKGIFRRLACLAFSINSHDMKFLNLHRKLYFLYFFVRPFRLIFDYKSSILKILFK